MNRGLETVYEDRVVPLRGLKIIADMYAVNVIDAVNKANAGRVDAQEALKLVDEANATIQREWKACMATFLTPEEARLAQQAQALFGAADQDIARVQAALQALTASAESGEGNLLDLSIQAMRLRATGGVPRALPVGPPGLGPRAAPLPAAAGRGAAAVAPRRYAVQSPP